MFSESSELPKRELPNFQPKKLHIDNLNVEGDVNTFEAELNQFLSRYGIIIDLIMMTNSKFRREGESVRSCYL